MLSYEWRELEALCERINMLRHRYLRAQRSKNMGLVMGLQGDIAMAKRQRELLVQHISARLGTTAAGHGQAPGHDAASRPPALPAAGDKAGDATLMFGAQERLL